MLFADESQSLRKKIAKGIAKISANTFAKQKSTISCGLETKISTDTSKEIAEKISSLREPKTHVERLKIRKRNRNE